MYKSGPTFREIAHVPPTEWCNLVKKGSTNILYYQVFKLLETGQQGLIHSCPYTVIWRQRQQNAFWNYRFTGCCCQKLHLPSGIHHLGFTFGRLQADYQSNKQWRWINGKRNHYCKLQGLKQSEIVDLAAWLWKQRVIQNKMGGVENIFWKMSLKEKCPVAGFKNISRLSKFSKPKRFSSCGRNSIESIFKIIF